MKEKDNGKRGKNSKKENRGGSKRDFLVSLILPVFIGVVAGVWLASYMRSIYGTLDGKAFIVLYSCLGMCVLSVLINIILHEAGHLIFGLLTGYSFLSFRIFSLTFIRENGRLRCKRYSVPGTAGQCLLAPPNGAVEELPFRLYNYGGVIINLFVSFLIILPILMFPQLSIHGRFMLGGFAAGGILLGITNGLPVKAFGIANDGYNVKSIKRDPVAKSSFRLQLELVRRQSEGQWLRDMPEEWFELPEGADLTNVMNAFILYMRYNRNLDRMDLVAARDSLLKLDTVLPKLPYAYRNLTNMGLLFLAILNGDSKEETEQYLTKQCKALIKGARNEINLGRVAYAYYKLYTKDEKKAKECRKRLDKLAGRYPIQAEADMNLMLIEYVDQLSESRTEA